MRLSFDARAALDKVIAASNAAQQAAEMLNAAVYPTLRAADQFIAYSLQKANDRAETPQNCAGE